MKSKEIFNTSAAVFAGLLATTAAVSAQAGGGSHSPLPQPREGGCGASEGASCEGPAGGGVSIGESGGSSGSNG